MRNDILEQANTLVDDIRTALQIIYDALNQGQQKQVVKDETVKALFDRYGVEYSE